MRQTKIIMGMPITVEIRNVESEDSPEAALAKVFSYFEYVDEKFSTYKETSEVSLINAGKLNSDQYTEDMQEVLDLCEETKRLTGGYFDPVTPSGLLDPSGIVKGWAIYKASSLLKEAGFKSFFIDAGGDIQVSAAEQDKPWTLGIRNPFNREETIKVLNVRNEGVATSGTYIRGQHIYNPHDKSKLFNESKLLSEVISITVIGKNIYEADRFATAAFAMGKEGINFIERQPGLEAYQIDNQGVALMTSNFGKYANIQNTI